MRLKLTHSKRPFQEVLTTFDKFKIRYLTDFTSEDIIEFEHTLAIHGVATISDDSGVLEVEVLS